jgi:hypothetical protein
MYFTSGRIKKCERCVDPNLAAGTPRLLQRRIEIAAEKDVGWYPEPFRSTWREILAGFNPDQRLLFEVTLGNRRRTPLFMMQATDIVNRVPLTEIDIELGTYPASRVVAARKRLAEKTVSSWSRPKAMTEVTREDKATSRIGIMSYGKLNRINPLLHPMRPGNRDRSYNRYINYWRRAT